jgi:RNA polymerase sigma-70 factor (ECF subfamily)
VGWATSHYKCTHEEARDIYQSSIIAFYDNIIQEKLQQLNGSVKTYLFAIGKNKILELRRAEKKLDFNFVVEEQDLEDVPDSAPAEKEFNLTAVERCLEQLGEPCRTMLELYYYHGTGLEELALTMHYKNSDTVKNMKSRCLSRLRELVTRVIHKH